jgi:two-component system chemotaxis sensor kinase CheA
MKKRDSVIILMILAALIAVTIFVSPVNRVSLDLESGNSGISAWEYMPEVDKLNRENGKNNWTSIEELSESMTVETDIFWLRGKLPEGTSIYSPALLLEFDFPVEVFVEGQKIYSYGTMRDVDRVLSFHHIIPIKNEYKQKMIYFRYPAREGLTIKELRHLTAWDMVSESEETRELANRQIVPLFLCAMGVFIGLCLIAIAAFQKIKKGAEAGLLAYSGGFVFLTSVNIINSLYAVSSAWNQPVFTFYLDYTSYYLIPFAAGSFMVALLKTCPEAQMKTINKVFPLFLVSVLLLSRIQGFDISKSDFVFNTTFLIYAVIMVYLLLKELRRGNKDLKIIIIGLIIIGITGVVDILALLNVTEHSAGITHIGIFVLSLCMVGFFAFRYERLYNDVRAANIQLVKSKEIIEEVNKDLDRKVVEKTSAIRNLFDNAEQGFLSFKKDLIVEGEYSLKCREIFGDDINGRSLPELIGDRDSDQEEYIYSLLKSIFDPKDGARREVYLSLLPMEMSISDKLISLDYKMLDKHVEGSELTCMVILTDITEKKFLEMSLKHEQSILKMCVAIVANHMDFVNVVADYRDFCDNRIAEIMDKDTGIEDKYAELFRIVHTFKGTFAYFEMQNIANKLHDFETKIHNFSKACLGLGGLEILISGNKPWDWLNEDFIVLREVLGERYMKLDKLVVAEESKLKEIENEMLSSFEGAEGLRLVKEIRKLRYRSLKEMLGHYPGYCARLSERQEKQIKEFEIQGSDIAVDPDVYSELSKSMVHIFRNLIDHGIEPAEVRINNGKSEQGNITCSIDVEGDKVEIIAADDGAGIDVETIREAVVQKGFISLEEAVAKSEAEILQMIFADGFTTASEATELSGRGVGLSTVKAEIVRLKGSIEVKTEKGIGTSFYITVPILN